jgi:catechol 2,3-dioxygenase-like lactoylglutathione lyase family enzyme
MLIFVRASTFNKKKAPIRGGDSRVLWVHVTLLVVASSGCGSTEAANLLRRTLQASRAGTLTRLSQTREPKLRWGRSTIDETRSSFAAKPEPPVLTREICMLDHIGLRTTQFDALARFYEIALAPLGHTKLFAWEGGAGFGSNGVPALWLHASKTPPSGIHIALSAPNRAAVDAFYHAAIGAGARDNGKPGLRADYHPNYYGAFVLDPDGNNLEAVCHVAAG